VKEIDMLYQLAAKAATWTASIPAADPTPTKICLLFYLRA
jgi:hypothetical protein